MSKRIKTHVDQVFENPNLAHAIIPPKVFRDRDQQATPSQLGEWAAFIAAEREFTAEVLQEARHTLDLVTAMQQAMTDDADDRLNAVIVEDAGALINRGFAAQERMSRAKLSQVERMVEVRAGQMQVDRLKAMVQQLEHVHREWRAAEFTLDRMIRITNLRLAVSDT